MTTPRRGMALPLVLIILLALSAFGHGALLLSRRELQATWAFRNLSRASEAAEIGLRFGWEVPPSPTEDRTNWQVYPLLSGETDDGLVYRATRRWIDGEFFLLEGLGGTRGWAGARTMGWIGWSLFPRARLRSFLAAAELGSDLVQKDGSRLTTEGFFRLPDGWSASDCYADQDYLDSLSLGHPLPPVSLGVKMGMGVEVRTEVEAGMEAEVGRNKGQVGSGVPSLGLLQGPELLRRAQELGGGSASVGVPGPDRGCPGSGQPVFEATPGTFQLTGGHLCGLLVSVGDLRLGGNSRFQGVALVGGDLILEDEAVFEGAARVGKSLLLRGHGTFSGSACPSLRALAGIPSLRDPVLLQGGLRLGEW